MDIKKITVFIGDQGSGKSSVAKLISTCTWLEKAMNRGDYIDQGINLDYLLKYQGLAGYSDFSLGKAIEFQGGTLKFTKSEHDFLVKPNSNTYSDKYALLKKSDMLVFY